MSEDQVQASENADNQTPAPLPPPPPPPEGLDATSAEKVNDETNAGEASSNETAQPVEVAPVVLSRDAEMRLAELRTKPYEDLSDEERTELAELAAAGDEADRRYTHMAAAQLRFTELQAKGDTATPEEAAERDRLETELNLRQRSDPETAIRDWVRRELHLLQQGLSEVVRRRTNP